MPLITLQGVDYSVGGPLLLENVALSLEAGERVALIGRNGAGKSTLMKLLSAELKPDDGEVRVEGGVRIARLEQEVPAGAQGDVFDVVAAGTSCSSRAIRTPPSTRTSPSSGLSSADSSFIRVDLPAPLRPIRATRSPASSERATFSSNKGPPTL